MMLKKVLFSIITVLLVCSSVWSCTIGIANGSATADGRPLLWKTRDAVYKDNVVFYEDKLYRYKFIAVTNAHDTRTWQGVNEKGLAILNSSANDLGDLVKWPSDNENGAYMRKALGYCATVDEFEKLLKETNHPGRETQTNFAVIDAQGNAAIFETASKEYWKYDTKDTENGYIVRTNFAYHGAGKNGIDGIYSADRFNRSSELLEELYADGKLTYKDILRVQMRDFSDKDSEPIEIPFKGEYRPGDEYGYINASSSICRSSTVSTAVIMGVLPGEDPMLSTMWTILGHPATTVAVPYWPVGDAPKEAYVKKLVTSPLCDTSLKIKALLFDDAHGYIDTFKLSDGKGGGLFKKLFAAEDKVFAEAEQKLAKWRKSGIDKKEMLETEQKLAKFALDTIEGLYKEMK